MFIVVDRSVRLLHQGKPDFCGFEPFLGMAGRYKQLVQYGRGLPIKAGQPESSLHLGTACEIHHIYEDLNESSSARRGWSQQLEIPPSLNSKQAACFSSPAFPVPPAFLRTRVFLPGPGISMSARILSPTWFSADARISQSRRIFSGFKYLYIFQLLH